MLREFEKFQYVVLTPISMEGILLDPGFIGNRERQPTSSPHIPIPPYRGVTPHPGGLDLDFRARTHALQTFF